MTDRYSRLTRVVSVPEIPALHVAVVVLENWIVAYGIPNTIMTDNCSHFVASGFVALGAVTGTKLITTTEYHSQSNGQVERFKKTLVARLQRYIVKHQTKWDTYVQPLT